MEKRRLADLRVVDLRVELEKRGLDKHGVKAALVDRLAQALRAEGNDSETYFFDIAEPTPQKRGPSAKRQRRNKEGETEQEGEEDDDEGESGDSSVQHEANEPAMDTSVDEKSGHPEASAEQEQSPKEAADDSALFKVPNPDMVEPQYAFTSEDTILLHTNRLAGADDTSSLAVNTDATSEFDQTENDDSDTVQSGKFASECSGSIEQQLPTEDTVEPVEQQQPEEQNDGNEGDGAMTPDTENQNGTAPTAETAAPDDAQRKDDAKQAAPDAAKGDSQTSGEKADSKASKGADLWISGLASSTRAVDLKVLFSKYGRVITTRIVQSTKTPTGKCYGHVVMSTPEEASKCIQHLHRTELNGKIITVERASNEQLTVGSKKIAAGAQSNASAAGTAQGLQAKKISVGNSAGGVGTATADVGQKAIEIAAADTPKVDKSSAESEKKQENDEKKPADDKDKNKETPKEKTSKDEKPKEKRKSRSHSGSRSRSGHHSGDSRDRRVRSDRPPPPPPPRRPARPPHRPIMSRPPPPLRPVYTRPRPGIDRARAALERARAIDMRRERERERERERARQREMADKDRGKPWEYLAFPLLDYIRREEKLKIEKEKERLKYERERLERERLELQQMKMQAATSYRMPPSAAPVMAGVKRPYDSGSTSYGPDAKRSSYGSYGGRIMGRDRSPHRRESYPPKPPARYGGDVRSSDRRTSSSSSRPGHREMEYRQHRDSGRSTMTRPSGSDRRPPHSPPRRSRDAPPPPPPPPRGAPNWGSSGRRPATGGTRERDGGYGNSSRMSSGGGGGSYGGRAGPQQLSGGHATAPWATAAGLSGMPAVGTWSRQGPPPSVGANMWPNVASSSMFPGGVSGGANAGGYGGSGGDRFDPYPKAYSGGSAGRRY